jgi:ATP-dependent Clp protease protease subunit
MDRDRFMTVEEAVEWGLVDRILHVRAAERIVALEA